jgi:hypothetical protein
MKRLNDKFGTTFTVFRHDEENVSKLFAGMEAHARKKYGETLWERKVQRPAAVRERIKDEIQYDLESPKRKKTYRQGRRCIRSFDEPDARTSTKGVTTSARRRSPPNLVLLDRLFQDAQAIKETMSFVISTRLLSRPQGRIEELVGMNLTTHLVDYTSSRILASRLVRCSATARSHD